MENIVARFLTLITFFILFSCKNESSKRNNLDDFKTTNRNLMRRHAFCTCLAMVDSCAKTTDFSKGIYFEKSNYSPEAFPKIDSFVFQNKPQFKSFDNSNLGIGECLELYESDTLKKAVEKLDKYLSTKE